MEEGTVFDHKKRAFGALARNFDLEERELVGGKGRPLLTNGGKDKKKKTLISLATSKKTCLFETYFARGKKGGITKSFLKQTGGNRLFSSGTTEKDREKGIIFSYSRGKEREKRGKEKKVLTTAEKWGRRDLPLPKKKKLKKSRLGSRGEGGKIVEVRALMGKRLL